jgi:hypothetical protein
MIGAAALVAIDHAVFVAVELLCVTIQQRAHCSWVARLTEAEPADGQAQASGHARVDAELARTVAVAADPGHVARCVDGPILTSFDGRGVLRSASKLGGAIDPDLTVFGRPVDCSIAAPRDWHACAVGSTGPTLARTGCCGDAHALARAALPFVTLWDCAAIARRSAFSVTVQQRCASGALAGAGGMAKPNDVEAQTAADAGIGTETAANPSSISGGRGSKTNVSTGVSGANGGHGGGASGNAARNVKLTRLGSPPAQEYQRRLSSGTLISKRLKAIAACNLHRTQIGHGLIRFSCGTRAWHFLRHKGIKRPGSRGTP